MSFRLYGKVTYCVVERRDVHFDETKFIRDVVHDNSENLDDLAIYDFNDNAA